jgi:ubiquinone/menaquinone biosynthesis C-methylase UbiE
MKGFLDPESILKQLKLKANMIAIDFGSGSGGWAIPLAKKLEDGKVIAVDILEEPLSALKSKLKTKNINNIEIIQSDVESLDNSKLFSGFCDLVLMTNLLFQTKDKEVVLKEGKRALKDQGKILIVDWKSSQSFGPGDKAISVEEIKILAEKLSLKVEKEFEAGPYHWGLVLLK